MRTSLLPLQKALYERLKQTPYKVYDDVPSGAEYPYIELGEDTMSDIGTKTFTAENITHTLHFWSEYAGKKEVKEMMALALQTLKAPLVIGNFTCYKTKIDYMNVIPEPKTSAYPNGLRHGIIRLRFFIYDLT